MLSSFYYAPDYQSIVSKFIKSGDGSLKMVLTTIDFLVSIERKRVRLQLQLIDIITRINEAMKLRRVLLQKHMEFYKDLNG